MMGATREVVVSKIIRQPTFWEEKRGETLNSEQTFKITYKLKCFYFGSEETFEGSVPICSLYDQTSDNIFHPTHPTLGF